MFQRSEAQVIIRRWRCWRRRAWTLGALAAVYIYPAGITAKTQTRESIRNGLDAGQIALELRQFLDGQCRQLALRVLLREFRLQLEGQLVGIFIIANPTAVVAKVLCPGGSGGVGQSIHFWIVISKRFTTYKVLFFRPQRYCAHKSSTQGDPHTGSRRKCQCKRSDGARMATFGPGVCQDTSMHSHACMHAMHA